MRAMSYRGKPNADECNGTILSGSLFKDITS